MSVYPPIATSDCPPVRCGSVHVSPDIVEMDRIASRVTKREVFWIQDRISGRRRKINRGVLRR